MNPPVQLVHETMRTDYDGRRSLFECLMPGCRFRATLDHADGGYTVLHRGEPSIRHHGSAGPVTLSAETPQSGPSRAA